tara:strand:+ start:346 stop:987 length:642 start_codon:yes stop_codon:yes gene_type:complete
MVAKDYKILGSGTLKGNPTYNYGIGGDGCETTCGTKQNWELGIYLPPKEVRNLIKIKTPLYTNNLFVRLNPETTEGGICTGKWKLANEPAKHKIKVSLKIYGVGNKILSENEYKVSGITEVIIPITTYGRYNFTIETDEWGEQCNKPKNTSKKTIYIEPPKENNGGNEENNGNGGVNNDNDVEPINPLYLKYAIATSIGAGVIIAISSFMSDE